MDKRKVIPSMFHRRLVLILAVFAFIGLILSGQLFRLSVVEGAERLAAAEAKLDQRTFLPTYRGMIYDRHGRVLAIDRASYDVAVEYDVITGAWIRNKASSQAKKEIGRNNWIAMASEAREEAILKRMPHWQREVDRLWGEICRLGKLKHEELLIKLDGIKADVQSKAASTWERQREAERKQYGVPEDHEYEFKPRPIVEQDVPHVILPRVPDEVAFEFRRIAQQMPGMLEVRDSRRRDYPWSSAEVSLNRNALPLEIRKSEPINIPVIGVADHILGGMRDGAWAEDSKRRPFRKQDGEIDLGWYLGGDSLGARGVERVFEDHLRGLRGEVRARRDSNQEIRTPPQPGKDLHLTIDIALQARVQAILSHQFGLTRVQPWHSNAILPVGTPLNAAAVVIEIETGEILAMVSMPTVAMGAAMNAQQQLLNQPMVNRAVEAVYPPGSIIKPLVLAAAISEGVQSLGAGVECTGQYFENTPNAARCWINRPKYAVKNHGMLHAEEALARSCNIFFYTLGDRLGMERLCKWFRRFGMGSALDVGLLFAEGDQEDTQWLGESVGSVPDAAEIAEFRNKGDLRFNQVIMGIGQGPIAWTPVQAANAFATLARGGSIRDATLILDDPRGERTKRCEDMKLSKDLVAAALEGLRQSVEERHGTGHHINHEGGASEPIINAVDVKVSAKTGTAQAPPLRLNDTNGDGVINSKDAITYNSLDHSWFVGLAGPRNAKPLHAIAVLVEYGGSGGRCAGPIANQIIRALQAEGYLPGDAAAGPGGVSAAPANEPEYSGDDH